MKIAVYAGSFDPITLGHIEIASRVSHIFDQTIILIAKSETKNYLFLPEERKALIEAALKNSKIKVDICDGLVVDYMKRVGAKVLIRGMRGLSDFDGEWVMAQMNKRLNPDMETMVIFSSLEHSVISSKVVKEIAINGGDLSKLVPSSVAAELVKRLKG